MCLVFEKCVRSMDHPLFKKVREKFACMESSREHAWNHFKLHLIPDQRDSRQIRELMDEDMLQDTELYFE